MTIPVITVPSDSKEGGAEDVNPYAMEVEEDEQPQATSTQEAAAEPVEMAVESAPPTDQRPFWQRIGFTRQEWKETQYAGWLEEGSAEWKQGGYDTWTKEEF
uniref:Uncharacterized protein n=1 Tax=Chromera velia CCMP2878 TaxID=1169474 RepID=A0A0G4HNJ8_9ALVE|eukprot:Cvel_29440.t1-p1 / transcript=Cvel_29440.t1 / gene=Cvel_29440 / organism=Chromera_velia_CCMP2878 / gene_product=hypothetical protein / transcript_product=hypothetical protein / location=Cvel_scaffold4022:8928-9374(+) / protein_length=101 / sequence_SO=supercontig / SO=protein_coding / is_pseudo=false